MTSTGLFGSVGEFIAERETFNAYVERMEMFFTANNIVKTTGVGGTQANRVVAERKRAILLTEVGAEVHSTLSNLLAPTKPKDTPFVDIVGVLQQHYNRSKTAGNCAKFPFWNPKSEVRRFCWGLRVSIEEIGYSL